MLLWCSRSFYNILLSCNYFVCTARPDCSLPIAELCAASWLSVQNSLLVNTVRWLETVKTQCGAAVSLQLLFPFPRTALWLCTQSGEDSSSARCGPPVTAAFRPSSLSYRWAWRVTWWCRPRWRSAQKERCGGGKRIVWSHNPALFTTQLSPLPPTCRANTPFMFTRSTAACCRPSPPVSRRRLCTWCRTTSSWAPGRAACTSETYTGAGSSCCLQWSCTFLPSCTIIYLCLCFCIKLNGAFLIFLLSILCTGLQSYLHCYNRMECNRREYNRCFICLSLIYLIGEKWHEGCTTIESLITMNHIISVINYN